MTFNPDIHHRRSIRLHNFDYSEIGYYFITICVRERECLLGRIIDNKNLLNDYGKIIEIEWLKTQQLRKNIKLDEFIIMPNHLHGIVAITESRIPDGRGMLQRASTVERFGKPVSNSIPTIIRLFKSTTTKQINLERDLPRVPLWQRGYYEHIIRSETELNRSRKYIINNPFKWNSDEDNPINAK